jgi:hypothetical protein
MQSTTEQIDNQLIDESRFGTQRRPGSSTDIELPGGWQLRHRVRPTSRSVFEIFDARLLWSLAMGHVVDDEDVFVTFLGRNPDGHLRLTTVTPDVIDDVWIAMITSHADVVALHQRTRHCLRRVIPTLRGCEYA